MSTKKLFVAICVLGAVVAISAVGIWYSPNRLARSQVRAVLRSDAPTKEQLERLQPYVRMGEDISKVRRRISPSPNESREIDWPTIWALQLAEDTSLVVAIASDGRIVGIGRDFHGDDKPEVWLVGPEWQ